MRPRTFRRRTRTGRSRHSPTPRRRHRFAPRFRCTAWPPLCRQPRSPRRCTHSHRRLHSATAQPNRTAAAPSRGTVSTLANTAPRSRRRCKRRRRAPRAATARCRRTPEVLFPRTSFPRSSTCRRRRLQRRPTGIPPQLPTSPCCRTPRAPFPHIAPLEVRTPQHTALPHRRTCRARRLARLRSRRRSAASPPRTSSPQAHRLLNRLPLCRQTRSRFASPSAGPARIPAPCAHHRACPPASCRYSSKWDPGNCPGWDPPSYHKADCQCSPSAHPTSSSQDCSTVRASVRVRRTQVRSLQDNSAPPCLSLRCRPRPLPLPPHPPPTLRPHPRLPPPRWPRPHPRLPPPRWPRPRLHPIRPSPPRRQLPPWHRFPTQTRSWTRPAYRTPATTRHPQAVLPLPQFEPPSTGTAIPTTQRV